MSTESHDRGCHCGRVRFRVHLQLTRATECNCSMCGRRGTLSHRVPPENFVLLAGADALSVYQFGTPARRITASRSRRPRKSRRPYRHTRANKSFRNLSLAQSHAPPVPVTLVPPQTNHAWPVM